MKFILSLFAISCLSGIVASAAEPPKPVLVEVNRIWHKAPHNGFTDLIR